MAGLISDTGDWALLVTLPLVVYRLSGSALGLSLTFIGELLPAIVLAPGIGRIVDRHDRAHLLLATTVAQAVALVPLLTVHDRSDLPTLYAVVGLEALLMAVFDPAKNALLPSLLPPDELVSGNALIGLNLSLGRLIGGPLGGLVFGAAGLWPLVIVDIASYLGAALSISALRDRPPTATRDGTSPPSVALTGVLRERALRPAILVTLISQMAQGMFVVLFVLFVVQGLGGGAGYVGLLRGVQAVGAIAAGALLATGLRRVDPGKLMTVSAALFGVLSLVIWNLPSLTEASPVYVVAFAIVGAPGVVLATGIVSSLQTGTVEAHRGQAFGALNLASNLGQGAGIIAAGALVIPFGLTGVLNSQASLYLLAAAIPGAGRAGGVRRCLTGSSSRLASLDGSAPVVHHRGRRRSGRHPGVLRRRARLGAGLRGAGRGGLPAGRTHRDVVAVVARGFSSRDR